MSEVLAIPAAPDFLVNLAFVPLISNDCASLQMDRCIFSSSPWRAGGAWYLKTKSSVREESPNSGGEAKPVRILTEGEFPLPKAWSYARIIN
jgi:hypothetical protein